MKKFLGFFVVAFVWSSAALAANINDQIEFSRSLLQTGKKAVIAKNMNFTEKESADFWKTYQTYQTDLQNVNDRMVTLVRDYANNYDALTDEHSKKMVKDYLDIQREQIKVREKHLSKFEKVLSPKQVARFYQIENKIDAAVRYELAAEIPLVPTTGSKEVSQK